jgi:hypothetical protein
MRILASTLSVAMLCSPSIASSAQTPSGVPAQGVPTATPTATPSTAPAQAPPPPPGPSTILAPALDQVQQTVNSVKVDKWKRGSVRDEAGTDIGSIVNDLQVNLPPLIKDSDATPGTVTKLLPVLRNVDALYDVLLRVVEAARISAPDEQANSLMQALSVLGNARLSLDDRILTAASTQEKQMGDLRVTVQKQAAFKCPAPPPAPVCPAPAPRKPKRKAATPATTTTKTPATPGANTTPPKTGP